MHPLLASILEMQAQFQTLGLVPPVDLRLPSWEAGQQLLHALINQQDVTYVSQGANGIESNSVQLAGVIISWPALNPTRSGAAPGVKLDENLRFG